MSQLSAKSNLRVIRGGASDPHAGRARDNAAEDAALVRSVTAGHAQAAAAFHDRIRPVVDRTINRLLGSRDPDFDDLIQGALIELVTSLSSFRGDCPLDAWVSIVSARVVYRHLRRRKLERRLFVLEGGDGFEVFERATMPQVGLRNLVRRIQSHLSGIDSKKSWTYVLHDVHGYELSEIAEITGSSVAAAQSRLVRGRRELHEKIAADPELSQWLVEFQKPAEAGSD